MSSAKNKKRWLVAIIAATSMSGVGDALAGSPEPLQRIGRFIGAGWGDGYHACETSGFRPMANLPPRSYYQKFDRSHGHGTSQCRPGQACANAVTTLYGGQRDRCDSTTCDGDHSCVSDGCDGVGGDSEVFFDSSMGPHDSSIIAPTTPMTDDTSRVEGVMSYQDFPDAVLEPEPKSEPARNPQPEPDLQTELKAATGNAATPAQPLPEELPAPKSERRKSKVKSRKNSKSAPSGSSDVPSISDSSSISPAVDQLAVDLHESQRRPIRPLPPQPKRELSPPEPSQTPHDSSEMSLPRRIPVESTPAIFDASPVPSEVAMKQVFRSNPTGIQQNPYVEMGQTDRGPSQRPIRLGGTPQDGSPDEPVTSEATHRVAEVPDWLIIKQPR